MSLKSCDVICAKCPSFQTKDRQLACEGLRAVDECLLFTEAQKLEKLLVEYNEQAVEYENKIESKIAEAKKLLEADKQHLLEKPCRTCPPEIKSKCWHQDSNCVKYYQWIAQRKELQSVAKKQSVSQSSKTGSE